MVTTITFHIKAEDKKRLKEVAKKKKLSLSTYCRFFLLEGLKKEEDGKPKQEIHNRNK